MTPGQEQTVIEALRFLLRDKQQSSRIEVRRIIKEYSNVGTRERIRELEGDADYCEELMARL